jgi:opacity protein-like surface antigen
MPEQVSDSTLRAISEATVGMPDSEAKQEGVGERSNPAKESLVQSKTKEEKMVSEEKGPASTVNPESAEKSKQSKIRKSLPVSVDAGVSAGLLTPIAEGIEEGSRGTTAGLRFALNYSPRWSVVLDVQRNNLRFHQEGDHGYSFLPEVPTPFPGARLNEAEVYEFSSWQFGAGLQYTVLDKYSWKPYVRVGWALQKPANYLIEYKYIDANEDQSEAYYTFRNEPAIKDIVQGAVGVNYPLGQRLTASAEATYQRQWKTPTQTPNVMAFKATIVYRLSNN